MPPVAKRRRRTGAEVRGLMLEAARATFSELGYGQATTREIARRAGVSETLLFRHFSSKLLLFEASVLHPLDTFLEHFTGSWAMPSVREDPALLIDRFVRGLYDLCHEHRELLLALPMEEVARPIPQVAFDRLERMADEVRALFGLHYDAAIAVRAAVLTVAMSALFEPSLFPHGDVGSERMVRELSALLVGGLLRGEPSTAEGPRTGE